jgi:hypothetical protein
MMNVLAVTYVWDPAAADGPYELLALIAVPVVLVLGVARLLNFVGEQAGDLAWKGLLGLVGLAAVFAWLNSVEEGGSLVPRAEVSAQLTVEPQPLAPDAGLPGPQIRSDPRIGPNEVDSFAN